MLDVLKAFVISLAVMVGCLVVWGLTGNRQQDHAEAAFKQWAKQCNPMDFHYGQTDDGAGQRAFIVTCEERKP